MVEKKEYHISDEITIYAVEEKVNFRPKMKYDSIILAHEHDIHGYRILDPKIAYTMSVIFNAFLNSKLNIEKEYYRGPVTFNVDLKEEAFLLIRYSDHPIRVTKFQAMEFLGIINRILRMEQVFQG